MSLFVTTGCLLVTVIGHRHWSFHLHLAGLVIGSFWLSPGHSPLIIGHWFRLLRQRLVRLAPSSLVWLVCLHLSSERAKEDCLCSGGGAQHAATWDKKKARGCSVMCRSQVECLGPRLSILGLIQIPKCVFRCHFATSGSRSVYAVVIVRRTPTEMKALRLPPENMLLISLPPMEPRYSKSYQKTWPLPASATTHARRVHVTGCRVTPVAFLRIRTIPAPSHAIAGYVMPAAQSQLFAERVVFHANIR